MRFFILICLLTASAHAEWSGKWQSKGESLFAKPEPLVEQASMRMDLDFEWATKWSLFKFKSQFLASAKTSLDPEERYEIYPKDLYLERRESGWYAKFGLFTANWEGTDGVNPMDLFTAKNYRDPLLIQALPSLALHTGWSNENQSYEFVYIPWQTAPLLPGAHSVWWPRRTQIPISSQSTELRLLDNPEYQIHNIQYLDESARHNWAARWQVRTDTGDWSFAVFEGANPQPLLQPLINTLPVQVSPKTIFQLVSPIEITPYLYKVRSAGAAYVKTFEQWIVRVAGQNVQTIGEQVPLSPGSNLPSKKPNWSQLYVLGAERNINIGPDTVILILQGSSAQQGDTGGLLTSSTLFNKALMLALRWPSDEKHIYNISTIYSLDNNSGFTGASWTYRINDEWSSLAGVDFLMGPEDSLLGILSNRSRFNISLIRAF